MACAIIAYLRRKLFRGPRFARKHSLRAVLLVRRQSKRVIHKGKAHIGAPDVNAKYRALCCRHDDALQFTVLSQFLVQTAFSLYHMPSSNLHPKRTVLRAEDERIGPGLIKLAERFFVARTVYHNFVMPAVFFAQARRLRNFFPASLQ